MEADQWGARRQQATTSARIFCIAIVVVARKSRMFTLRCNLITGPVFACHNNYQYQLAYVTFAFLSQQVLLVKIWISWDDQFPLPVESSGSRWLVSGYIRAWNYYSKLKYQCHCLVHVDFACIRLLASMIQSTVICSRTACTINAPILVTCPFSSMIESNPGNIAMLVAITLSFLYRPQNLDSQFQ